MDEAMRCFTPKIRVVNYIPIPRTLLEGGGVPATALLIYGLLLDRCILSQKNGGFAENGLIYAVFPQLELADKLGISPSAVKKNLNALENAGLIRRERRRKKEASRVYLMVPSDCVTDTGRGQKVTTEGPKSVCGRGQKVSPSYLNKLPDLANAYHGGEESL